MNTNPTGIISSQLYPWRYVMYDARYHLDWQKLRAGLLERAEMHLRSYCQLSPSARVRRRYLATYYELLQMTAAISAADWPELHQLTKSYATTGALCRS